MYVYMYMNFSVFLRCFLAAAAALVTSPPLSASAQEITEVGQPGSLTPSSCEGDRVRKRRAYYGKSHSGPAHCFKTLKFSSPLNNWKSGKASGLQA